MTQTDMNLCALEERKQVDAELEKIYQQLYQKTNPANKEHLRTARMAWESYREQQCTFNTLGTAGGTAHGVVESYCSIGLAKEYIKILKHQLYCEEGDLSCGGQ